MTTRTRKKRSARRGAFGPTVTRTFSSALCSLLLLGCPMYDRGSCVVERDACPEGTTCDIRSGYCVRRTSRQAERPNANPTPSRVDAGAGDGGNGLNSTGAGSDGGLP